MTLGFIGLGNLGTAIAKRLASMDENVVVWNRSKAKVDALGFPSKSSPKELIESCDIVMMCLFDSNGVRDVLTMPNGLLSADLNGKIIIGILLIIQCLHSRPDFGANPINLCQSRLDSVLCSCGCRLTQ